jgi:hypothetical protein
VPIQGILAAPDPHPTQPPGTQGLLTLLDWGAWGVTLACVAGVLIVASMMAVKHRRGEEGGDHLGKLGWVLAAAVLGAAAGPLVTAVGG